MFINLYYHAPYVSTMYNNIINEIGVLIGMVKKRSGNIITQKQALLGILEQFVEGEDIKLPTSSSQHTIKIHAVKFKTFLASLPWRPQIDLRFFNLLTFSEPQDIFQTTLLIALVCSGEFRKSVNHSYGEPLKVYRKVYSYLNICMSMPLMGREKEHVYYFVMAVEKVPRFEIDNHTINFFDYNSVVRFYTRDTPLNKVNELWKEVATEMGGMPQFNFSPDETHLLNSRFMTPYSQSKDLKAIANVLKTGKMHRPSFASYRVPDGTKIVYQPGLRTWHVIDEKQTKEYKSVISRNPTYSNQELSFYENTQRFVELLQKIPNFKVKLTQQQAKVVGTPGNIVLIGRSGTGKTTTAVLRLFALEIVYRLQKFGKNTRSKSLDESVGLHCIFATASPVLTNEIYRYYGQLTGQIRAALREKEDKKRKQQEQKKKQALSQQEQIEEIKDTAKILQEELKDIKLQHPVESSESDQKGKEDKYDENVALKFSAFSEMTDNDFPAFFTIKSLILMIDKCLMKPFFYHSKATKNVKQNIAEWHNEEKGIMIIDDYYRKMDVETDDIKNEEETQEQQYRALDVQDNQLEEGLSPDEKIKSMRRKKFGSNITFEVDFSYFETNFWPLVKSNYYYTRINCHMVWTEIFSVIKGSKYSGLTGLTKAEYMKINRSNNLDDMQKSQVYNCYRAYQRWKSALGAYDFMDVVNYILHQLNYNRYQGPILHYLMIDQVQDLTYATIKLLKKITKYNIFFCGDTAQSIAKGIGFKFSEIKSSETTVLELTTNFRSHNSILELAHSVIEILEMLYPQTIDIMKKEDSPVQGPKPILNKTHSESFFTNMFFGDSSNPQSVGGTSQLQFGCDQVIIVRNQEAKERLPDFMKLALCLTLYECKGLEFNDVILYNFFADSDVIWGKMRTFEESPDLENQKNLPKSTMKRFKLQKQARNNEFWTLDICSELKHLYTAITRPKRSLIIYDSDLSKRKHLERLWVSCGLVQVSDGADVARQLATKSSPELWDAQGKRLLKKMIYEQAYLCFKYSGSTVMATVCQAHICADRAVKTISKIRSYEQMSMTQKEAQKLTKAKIKQMRKEAEDEFYEAAKLFNKVGYEKEAAKCYFSGKKYAEALKLFEKLEMREQAAECYFMEQNYTKALQLYQTTGNLLQQIECLDILERWEDILLLVADNKSSFSEDQRNAVVNKYTRLAYERLLNQIETEQKEVSNNNNKQQGQQQYQQVIQTKQLDKTQPAKSTAVINNNVISEEDEENALKDDEEDEFYDRKKQARKIANQIMEIERQDEKINELDDSQIQEINNLHNQSAVEEIKQNKQDISQDFADLNVSGDQSFSQVSNQGSNFFNRVNNPNNISDSFALLNEPDMEAVKSLVDPEDEWLGKSISEIKKGTFSEYSVLGETTAVKANIIKTRGNIFVQDSVMKKLISITRASSEELEKYLESRRSKNILVSKDQKTLNVQTDDFDVIDPALIGLVLDSLEAAGYFKLCIYVCNRYGLPERIGRYLVSIGNQYSVLSKNVVRVTKTILIPTQFRKTLLEKGVVCSLALHNAFEIINPAFFNFKESLTNLLGQYCVEGLVFLGIYKKAVFMLPIKRALTLLHDMFDCFMYAEILLSKSRENKKENRNFELNDKYPPVFHCQQLPSSKQEQLMSVFALENALEHLLVENRVEFFLSQNYINERLRTTKEKPYCIIPFYFERTKAFWDQHQKREYFVSCLQKAQEIKDIKKMRHFAKYDYVCSNLLSLCYLSIYPETFEEVVHILAFQQKYEAISRWLTVFKDYLIILSGERTKYPEILDCVLSLFGVKIPKSECFQHLMGSQVFTKRGSWLLNTYCEAANAPTPWFVDQGLNIVAVNRETAFKLLINKIRRSLNKLLYSAIKIFQVLIKQAKTESYEECERVAMLDLYREYFSNWLMKAPSDGDEVGNTLITKKDMKKIDRKNLRKKMAKYNVPSSSQIGAEVYYAEPQNIDLSESQEQGEAGSKGFLPELNFPLQNPDKVVPGYLRNFVLHRLCKPEKGKRLLESYSYLLCLMGMSRQLGEVSRQCKIYTDLFQASEFRRFGRLDDYIYHLKLMTDSEQLSIVFPKLLIHLFVEAAIVVVAILIKKSNKPLSIPKDLLRFVIKINTAELDFQLHFSSQLQEPQLLAQLLEIMNILKEFSQEYERDFSIASVARMIATNLQHLFDQKWFASAIDALVCKQVLGSLEEGVRTSFLLALSKESQKTEKLNLIRNYYVSQNSWKKPIKMFELTYRDVSDLETSIEASERDYERYLAQTDIRIAATQTITSWLKSLIKAKKSGSYLQKHELMDTAKLLRERLLNLYHTTSQIQVFDTHYILSMLAKVKELELAYLGTANNQKLVAYDQMKELFRQVQAWEKAVHGEFKMKSLKKKNIQEIKWVGRHGQLKRAILKNKKLKKLVK